MKIVESVAMHSKSYKFASEASKNFCNIAVFQVNITSFFISLKGGSFVPHAPPLGYAFGSLIDVLKTIH